MNYEININQTYNLDLDYFSGNLGSAYVLISTGEVLSMPVYTDYVQNQADYESIAYYCVNYGNRFNTTNGSVTGYLFNADTGLYLCMANSVDYVIIGNSTTMSTDISAGYARSSSGTYYDINDLSTISNYPSYYNSFTNFTYGSYSRGIDQNEKTIFDYSLMKYDNSQDYRYDSLALRGENTNIYNTCLQLDIIAGANPNLTISYGNPYYQLYNEGYDNGYVSGNQAGYINGYDSGFSDGLTYGVGTNEISAFNYIGMAFNSLSGILSLQVLPHVTLGLCFSIPLTFTLIMLIFKMVKR